MTSKRFKKLPEKTLELPPQAVEKLIPEVKKNCTTKFDESVDLSFQINNKQKKSEVNIRTVVNLPGRTINFPRAAAVDAGYAGFDGAVKGSKLLNSLSTGSSPDIIDRKSVGNANALRITWTSGRQIGANRRAVQKSVVSQTSMSATIQSILKQGGRISSIAKA